jgi:hypothetical protein
MAPRARKNNDGQKARPAAKRKKPIVSIGKFSRRPVEYCREQLRVVLTPAQEQIARLLVEPPYKVLVRASHCVGETIQTSCGANASAEPTVTDGGLWWELQPQTGIIEPLAPGQEIKIPGGQSAQFEFTSPGTPTVMMEATCEE